MTKSLSELINVTPKKLFNEGCFDTILNTDALLFINFARLKNTKTPELKGAYNHILKLFGSIGKLLLASKSENDIFWKKAFTLLKMSEFQEICLGYAISSTAGAGSGSGLKTTILKTGKQILEAGVNEPEIFELVGLFEDNIGSDRLSDFIAHTIRPYLENFTKRVLFNLKINLRTRTNLLFCDGFLINPFNGKKIYLLPFDILHELPIAREWEDIETVCLLNAKFRDEVNKKIGKEWQKLTTIEKKSAARMVLRNNSDLFRALIEDYRKFELSAYDFAKDPLGEASWYPTAKAYAQKYPLIIPKKTIKNITDLKDIVLSICNKFKEHIEVNGLNEDLYSDGKPRKERIAQKLFFCVADSYCESNNIDISPETNAGRGAVDFKFSIGYKMRVVVEVKLTTNNKLIHGFEKQIKEYQKSERNACAIYLVIDNGGSQTALERLIKIYNDQLQLQKNACDLIIINGTLKQSASKM